MLMYANILGRMLVDRCISTLFPTQAFRAWWCFAKDSTKFHEGSLAHRHCSWRQSAQSNSLNFISESDVDVHTVSEVASRSAKFVDVDALHTIYILKEAFRKFFL